MADGSLSEEATSRIQSEAGYPVPGYGHYGLYTFFGVDYRHPGGTYKTSWWCDATTGD
jgi:hypothetical protein